MLQIEKKFTRKIFTSEITKWKTRITNYPIFGNGYLGNRFSRKI